MVDVICPTCPSNRNVHPSSDFPPNSRVCYKCRNRLAGAKYGKSEPVKIGTPHRTAADYDAGIMPPYIMKINEKRKRSMERILDKPKRKNRSRKLRFCIICNGYRSVHEFAASWHRYCIKHQKSWRASIYDE